VLVLVEVEVELDVDEVLVEDVLVLEPPPLLQTPAFTPATSGAQCPEAPQSASVQQNFAQLPPGAQVNPP
jgi:hypothetical protein